MPTAQLLASAPAATLLSRFSLTVGKKKNIPNSALSGQKGINVIEEASLAMGFPWHPAGPFDAGIDGRIEMRDARTGEPVNRLVGVQSKGWDTYTAEDDAGFEFLCEEADIRYWLSGSEPVLLVCSHPRTREAWFKCVTDWFADPARRASRRVYFDKHADRFDASRAVDLLALTDRDEPAHTRRLPAPPEDLVTNLLPILSHGKSVWSAPSAYSRYREASEHYESVGGARASDFILRDGKLHSLRNPATCALRHLCHIERAESKPSADWAESDDPRVRRYWVELLGRTLLQQVKYQLRWHPKRELFYFPAPDPLAAVSIEGPNGPRQVVKVERFFDKRRNQERLKYVRHHAFRPGFERVDDSWHLEIEPNYFFTGEDDRESYRAPEYLAGIKRLDRNLAVLGHLRMWEHFLIQPPSLLSPEPPLLTFGRLAQVRVERGIDDALWLGKRDRAEVSDQEQLAA